jgi:hypothetical protein
MKMRPCLLFVLFFLCLEQFNYAQNLSDLDLARIQELAERDTFVTPIMTPVYLNGHYNASKAAEYNRLRNAVFVTYPYARKAGIIMNEIKARLPLLPTEAEKKKYLKSREKELKKEFTTPLTKLSVYQGKVLMKLINRETGNNCYDIIKEYKGGFIARFWQTVAFFFDTNLKQPYHPTEKDKLVEQFVKEVQKLYGYPEIAKTLHTGSVFPN